MNYQKVREFMIAFGQSLDINILPATASKIEVLRLREALIEEETHELYSAIVKYVDGHTKSDNDEIGKAAIEIVDALTDLLYVTYGAFAAFGINADKAFEIVHRSNMTKLGEDGKPVYRQDGKVLKGPQYKPPDLEPLIKDSITTQSTV
jgi:predicted HAD superfamily Cof-like phosphohydrolase